MKILVTGANGQVGSCLHKLLQQTAWRVLSLDRNQLDISDTAAIDQIVSGFLPDIIINAAAYTAVDTAESNAEQAYKINVYGAANLAEAAAKIDAAIFHISTDYVFAGNSAEPYQEDDRVAPKNIYGLSKLKGEQEVAKANSKHIILRTAWVFGEHGNNFVKIMIRLGRNREQLGIVSDQLGGPTYAGDIASALLAIARQYEQDKHVSWGIYHFSGFPFVSWFEFAQAIFAEVSEQNIYDKNIPLLDAITTAEYPTLAKRPANSRLNCRKIQKTFNIPMSDWKHALKNIKAYS